MTANFDEKVYAFADGKPKTVRVTLKGFAPNAGGTLRLKVPAGFTASPAELGAECSAATPLVGRVERGRLVRYATRAEIEQSGLALSDAYRAFDAEERFGAVGAREEAAGECIAAAQHMPWEDVIATRIFAPLDMRSSAPSLTAARAADDRAPLSKAYHAGRAASAITLQDISTVGPAGGIVSNATDMAQWLRVMLGGGAIDGRRLVSPAGFTALLTPQIRVSADAEYGLGWGLARWRGTKLVTHSGGTDGFSALVDLLPDRHAGLVFLDNVPENDLINDVRAVVWEGLLDLRR